jgi:hypothetical protein
LLFFEARQEVIGEKHAYIQDQDDDTRPDGQQAEASDGQTQVLRVPDVRVNPGVDHAFAEELGAVNLEGTE